MSKVWLLLWIGSMFGLMVVVSMNDPVQSGLGGKGRIRDLAAFDVGGHLYRVDAVPPLALAAAGGSGTVLIDIRDPANPKKLDRRYDGTWIFNVLLDPPFAFAVGHTAEEGRLLIYRIGPGDTLEPVSTVVLPPAATPTPFPTSTVVPTVDPEWTRTYVQPRSVALSSDHALVAATTGLYAVALSPVVQQAPDPPAGDRAASFTDVHADGDRAYVTRNAYEVGGFSVYDISNPSQPRLIGQQSVPGLNWLDVEDGMLYGVFSDVRRGNGLEIYDLSSSAPHRVGGLKFDRGPQDIKIAGSHAFVTLNNDLSDGRLPRQLVVIDLSDPSLPSVVDSFDVDDRIYGLDVEGDLAYLANGSAGLRVVDVSAYTSPSRALYLPSVSASPGALICD